MRRIIVFLLICLVNANTIIAQETSMNNPKSYLEGLPTVKKKDRPTVGLVLCGGGAKGAAHIGAIKVLEKYGVPVDLVVGTSIGALVGGLYSMGYNAHQMDSIISNCDWDFLLSDRTERRDVSFKAKQIEGKFLINIPFANVLQKNNKVKDKSSVDILLPGGYIDGQNVYNLLTSLSVGYQDSVDFMKLPIPFACVATNLVTGYPVVLRNGNLPLSMRASMAIPGFFSTVDIDDKVLVDGGVVDNFPVDVARKMGADIVIGVDIQNSLAKKNELKAINQVIMQLVGLTGNDLYLKNVGDVDIYIKPDVNDFSTFSFNKAAIDSLIVNGYIAAMDKSEELQNLVKKYGKFSSGKKLQAPAAKELADQFFYLKKIYIKEVANEDVDWLRNKIKVKEDTFVSGDDILKSVSILSGTKAFSSVSYDINTNTETGESTLTFQLKKGPTNVIGIGARYDSEEAAAILLYLGMNVHALVGPQISVTGRLSYNPYAMVDFSYLFKNRPRLNLNYTFRSVNMNIYENDYNRDYLSYFYNKLDFSVSNRYLRNFNFSFGVKIESYKYRDLLYPYTEEKMYKDGVFYLGYYFNGKMDTRDNVYFPTNGDDLNIAATFYQTDFKGHFIPTGVLKVCYGHVVSFSDRFAVIPYIYSRFLIGNEEQLPFMNYLGGEEPGRYMAQQLPFMGINYAYIFPGTAIVARADFRYRIGKKHYVSAIGNYARYGDAIYNLWDSNSGDMWGVGLKYAYNSPLGPLSFNIHYSDYKKRLGAYVNLGFYF